MAKSVLRPKEPKPDDVAHRPHNRLCQFCKKWVHKDLLAKHLRTKHGIEPKTLSSDPEFAIKARLKQEDRQKEPAKSRVYRAYPPPRTARKNLVVEPLYERQPQFEGGLRWSQAGIPGLGKKRP